MTVLELVPPIVGDGYEIEPDKVLDAAKGQLSEAIVIGLDHDGNIYFAGTHGGPKALWLIELAKLSLFQE